MKRGLVILTMLLGVLAAGATTHAGVATAKHAASPPEERIKVTLLPEVEVRTDQPVTVVDVATIDGPKARRLKIAQVVVTGAPLPGSKRSIESEYVKLKLGSAGFGDVKVAGAARITLTGKCRRVGPKVLEDAAKDYAMGLLPQGSLTYEIEVERSPREMVLPDDPSIELKPRLFGPAIHVGVNTIAIDALASGRAIRTTSAVLRIKSTAVVLVAADTIAQGQALTASNTRSELRDITRLKDPILAGAASDANWVARRTLQPGAVISASDVALPPDIRAGDQITLSVRCGAVAVRTSAQARQDGRIGDSIRVRSNVSDDEVRARITGPGAVEIVR
jgi:flagella basal body P-ring formation protein FlgA